MQGLPNYKFHDPQGRGSCSKVWLYKSFSETALFLKGRLVYTQAQIRQSESIVITKEEATTIVNLMTIG